MKILFAKSSLVLGIFLLLISSCAAPDEDISEDQVASGIEGTVEAFANQTETTIAAEPTATPTKTLTPTITITPAPTLTPSPTPFPEAEVISDSAFLRAGPGTNYKAFEEIEKGEVLDVLGRSEDSLWLAVVMMGDPAWISVEDVQLTVEVDTLVVIEAPPTPEPVADIVWTITNNSEAILRVYFLSPAASRWEIPKTQTRSITLKPGRYTLEFDDAWGPRNCVREIVFTTDVYWDIYEITDICGG